MVGQPPLELRALGVQLFVCLVQQVGDYHDRKSTTSSPLEVKRPYATMACMSLPSELTIGETARRSGLSAPTLRYDEERGLIRSTRSSGNQRRYPRHILRRLAFISAAQRVGLSLGEIAELLDTLPPDRAPSREDWTTLSRPWRQRITARIEQLQTLQDTLDGCLGCGCLSLTRCRLYNPDDEATNEGPGSRWLRSAGHTPP
jgi:MerR family redox-sensitive transcriptional activator SoxR